MFLKNLTRQDIIVTANKKQRMNYSTDDDFSIEKPFLIFNACQFKSENFLQQISNIMCQEIKKSFKQGYVELYLH